MAYAAEVWYAPPHRTHATASRRSGMITFSNKLQSIQRKAAINILGAMRTTAGDVLNTHTFLPPPHLLLLKLLIRSVTRLLTLPQPTRYISPPNVQPKDW